MRDVVDGLRPREREAVALLTQYGPMQRAKMAALLGCAPATAGQHLWMCSRVGAAHNRGVGRMAVWHPGPAPERAVLVAAKQAQHHLAAVWR